MAQLCLSPALRQEGSHGVSMSSLLCGLWVRWSFEAVGLWCCTGEYILQCICTCRLQLQLKMLNCINSHIAHYQSWIHWSCPWLLTVITDVGDGFQSSAGTSHWRAMRALFCQWISQQLADSRRSIESLLFQILINVYLKHWKFRD